MRKTEVGRRGKAFVRSSGWGNRGKGGEKHLPASRSSVGRINKLKAEECKARLRRRRGQKKRFSRGKNCERKRKNRTNYPIISFRLHCSPLAETESFQTAQHTHTAKLTQQQQGKGRRKSAWKSKYNTQQQCVKWLDGVGLGAGVPGFRGENAGGEHSSSSSGVFKASKQI